MYGRDQQGNSHPPDWKELVEKLMSQCDLPIARIEKTLGCNDSFHGLCAEENVNESHKVLRSSSIDSQIQNSIQHTEKNRFCWLIIGMQRKHHTKSDEMTSDKKITKKGERTQRYRHKVAIGERDASPLLENTRARG